MEHVQRRWTDQGKLNSSVLCQSLWSVFKVIDKWIFGTRRKYEFITRHKFGLISDLTTFSVFMTSNQLKRSVNSLLHYCNSVFCNFVLSWGMIYLYWGKCFAEGERQYFFKTFPLVIFLFLNICFFLLFCQCYALFWRWKPVAGKYAREFKNLTNTFACSHG